MCDFPINIANPNYGKVFGEYKRITVPCNKCKSCFQRRADAWYIRLRYQLKESITAHFVTLTYQHPPRSYNDLLTCKKDDLQNYFKRLRKREKNNTDIKYYAVSEYGEKYNRPHYHAILFNVRNERNIDKAWSVNGLPIGITHIGTVTDESIRYVTGYIGKRIGIPVNDYDDRLKEFSLMSKNMGTYFIDNVAKYNVNNELGYTVLNGIKYNLPRYYKEKIFDSITKRKISKNNYVRFIQTKDLHVKNFPSFGDCELNRWEIAKRDNFEQTNIVNNNF